MMTLLFIEDALELAQVTSRELEAAGYTVRHAATGTEGLHLAQQEPPDLVILDWMLPGGMDGLDVLRRLRALRPELPVLMLTARAEEIDRVVGLEVGADDYLTKPFGMRELIARVRALLRRGQVIQQTLQADRADSDQVLHYGTLSLDATAHRVTLDGTFIELSPGEFALLQLLMKNVGRAFSRAYLIDALWGEDHVSGDRSIDNTVLRLRKKLSAVGEAIETVWGVGYRLREP